jgi:glycosyltransferase involved in cell wall biosynthesis
MLPACLESVLPVAKEIILVDTGSDDNTIELAHKSGCKVIESKWENDFSKARNLAISNAKCEYILSIDADERLLNPEAILKTLTNAKDETGAWLVEVKSEAITTDRKKDVYVSNLLRLFRNKPFFYHFEWLSD